MRVLGAVGLLSLLTACAPVTQRPAISDAAMKAEAERQLELAAGEAKVQAHAPLVPNVKEGKFEPPRK